MKSYKLHAYGIADAIQITETQRDDLMKLCSDPRNHEQILEVNGFMVKLSAVATVEPNYDKLEDYLIEKYNSEAALGLHEAYAKPLEANCRNSYSGSASRLPEDKRINPSRLSEEDRAIYEKWYADCQKAADDKTGMEYICAKMKFRQENHQTLDDIRRRMR